MSQSQTNEVLDKLDGEIDDSALKVSTYINPNAAVNGQASTKSTDVYEMKYDVFLLLLLLLFKIIFTHML